MLSGEIIEQLRASLDPLIRTVLIGGVPLIIIYLLARFVMPLTRTYRIVRFRGLPSVSENDNSAKPVAKWAKHLVLLSRSISTGDESDEELIQRFFVMTVGAFLGTFVVYGFWTGLFDRDTFMISHLVDRWAVTISLMAATVPYFLMRMKLHRVRIKNSYDLVPAVNTLLLKYSEYRGNLYYAVFETTKGLNGDILNAFVGLLPSLQGAANSNIEEAIELFIFRIKTTWSIQLGILIHKSEEQGDNIDQGLRWLIADMSEVAKITEELKSENRETMQLAYMPAILLPAVIYLNQFPSMGKSWHYYFQTPLGIRMIVFTLLFTLLCALIAYMIQKPRNEV
ncbi:hypothetical protein [Paenibacillus abyssi]|uniref:Type II secretion system protein GspF domain-containing protein n=1 Tax=Paenibacillus abyssi TaxID=1340531 RepID=A0A917LFP6_9BACL|nr:hypothetical protein [Paenibacillus abyssi]GGG18789.1 hypothetical protein GCM10010916_39490 [Paenibacillus abyssi]